MWENERNQFLCVCVGVQPCLCAPTPHCMLSFVCMLACLHKCALSIYQLFFFPSFHPASCLNDHKQSTEAAGFSREQGEEEAGILMIPHHCSDKRRDMFPLQKQRKKKKELDYLPTLSLSRSPPSLPPPCVLNALLPSPWTWAFILLVEENRRRGEFTGSCPLQWCWNTGITGVLQGDTVFTGSTNITPDWSSLQFQLNIFSLKTKHLGKTPEAIQMALFDVRHILTYQKPTLYFDLPALQQRLQPPPTPHYYSHKWKAGHQTQVSASVALLKLAAYCHLSIHINKAQSHTMPSKCFLLSYSVTLCCFALASAYIFQLIFLFFFCKKLWAAAPGYL